MRFLGFNFNITRERRLFSISDLDNAMDLAVSGFAASSGINVNPDTARKATAVYCALTIYAGTIGSLPLPLYKKLPNGGKERDRDHWLYPILHDAPNRWQTPMEWREMMMGHVLLRGNAYSEIISSRGRPIDQLIPLHPDRVELFVRDNGKLVYIYRNRDGSKRPILQEDMFHLRGLSDNGFLGLSTVNEGAEAIGLTLATEKHAATFFKNDASPGGVLEHPTKLTQDAYDRIVKSWEKRHAQAHKIALLEEGMKWQTIGLKASDAQLLESRKFGVNDIARLFNLPPHVLKDLERATFSNIEQQAIELVVYSFRPWLVRWEQVIHRDLFTEQDRKTHFVEFLVEGLLRGDAAARGEYYTKLFGLGAISPNEIRARENLYPVDGGDTLFVPLNMVRLEDAVEPPEPAPAPAPVLEEPEEEEADGEEEEASLKAPALRAMRVRQRIQKAHSRLFEQAGRQIIRKEVLAIRKMLKKAFGERAGPVEFQEELAAFYKDQVPAFAKKAMIPALMSFADVIQAESASEIGSAAGMTPELEQFVRGYGDVFSVRHSLSSNGQIRKLISETEPESLVDAIEKRLVQWEERRPHKIAMRETIEAGAAISKKVWRDGGVQQLIWVAAGSDTCPICTELDGRIVGITSEFSVAGQGHEGDGGSQLVTSRGISHPPIHEGCECQISPA